MHGRRRQNDTEYQTSANFRLVSMSTIISRVTGRIEQLEESEIGVGKLHSECLRIKGILEALKSACDKSSCLEYILLSHFEYRV
jgi:hypothetical protein